jgi:polyisoprenoid-binding protein YceI
MATETWEIDASHSSVGFSVRHMVVAKVHGVFKHWSGKLELDTNDLTRSRVEATIDTGSIDTRDEKRDGHLKSPDFLDAEKFPHMQFTSKRVDKTGPETFKVTGDLTLHGVTRELALDAEYGGRAKDPWGGERAGFTVRTKLDRKDFGLQWNVALETGGVLVADTIEITIEVEAKKTS